ncbi:MAG: hypothetical protein BWX86_02525 [Verrucomicrobia bacterium ADurb.Bin122]|nr:MAG: hypothetical protein BWX86_02525 [Verrucomicrobia bacterium ADurb.Bin122]
MHVVAQAGAVGRRVIGAEDLEVGAFAGGHLDRERDEVRLGIVVLTDGAVLGGAGGVEIAEGGEAQPVRGRERLEHVFHVELGLAVGVDRSLREILGHRQTLGHTEGRAGRGEDEFLHAGLEHGVEQVQRRHDVVLVVLHRRGDRLAHVAEGGKVHHQLDFLLAQDVEHRGGVAEIGCVKRNLLSDGLPVSVGQIIQHHGAMAGGDQLANTVTADVTGTSDDKYVHGLKIGGRLVLPSDTRWLALFPLHALNVTAHRHHRRGPHRPQRQ